MSARKRSQSARRVGFFVLTLLAIELLDELAFGVNQAAWPLIRDDLELNYSQIGILLGAPGLVSSIVEPFIGILGDVWRRRVLVLGGGMLFALALLVTGLSHTFGILLLSFVLMYPTSGAFVSLSQATLMDISPTRHQQNMARWTFAGSVGVVCGSLALGAASASGLSWRALFVAMAILTLIPLGSASLIPFASGYEEYRPAALWSGFAEALKALRRREVLRWLTLLTFSDLMLDVLLGYLALYFVDVVGTTLTQASVAVAVWTAVGLLGSLLLIPVLERIRGLDYLRVSTAIALVVFPAFLLVPAFWGKLMLLGLLGLANTGWYTILQAQLYSAVPGRSGSVMTIGSLFGLVGGLLPLSLGLLAQHFGLALTMWLLLLGPVVLLVGIPRPAGRLHQIVG